MKVSLNNFVTIKHDNTNTVRLHDENEYYIDVSLNKFGGFEITGKSGCVCCD